MPDRRSNVGPHDSGSSADRLVDLICSDLEKRLRQDRSARADLFLDRHPSLSDDQRVDVIYAEFLIRERLGESCSLEEYQQRFPQFAELLRDQVALHRALQTPEITADDDTSRNGGSHTADLHVSTGRAGAENEASATASIPAANTSRREGVPSLPGYEILRELGRGGMGVVYLARHRTLRREVAIKVLLAGGHADARHLQRFQTEAAAVARLHHAGIVQIYEVGEADGRPFLALEFVAGGSLAHWIREQSLTPRQSATLVWQLANAVEYAHRRGIIHRDLKPSNVLLQPVESDSTSGSAPGQFEPLPWTTKIADFGLAKILDETLAAPQDSPQTRTGDIMGTPAYMSPEQARGEFANVGKGVDVYALGAILYESLTGRRPFQGATPLDVISQILSEEPIAPTRLVRRLPRDVEIIALKCLRKREVDRYDSAAALADDLERYLKGEPIRARPASPAERARRWVRRHPAASLMIGLTIFAVVAAGIGWNWLRQRERFAQLQTLVESLNSAESQAVSPILDRIAPQRRQAIPLLHDQLQQVPIGSPNWFRVALALHRCDGSQSAALLHYLPACRVDEVPLLIDAFRVTDGATSELWQEFQQAKHPERRLRIGAVLASIDSENGRWSALCPELAELLVERSVFELGIWTHAFRPIGSHLMSVMSAVSADRSRSPASRDVAAQFAAEFAGERPDTLVKWLAGATPTQFHVFLAKLSPTPAVRSAIKSELQHWGRVRWPSETSELGSWDSAATRDQIKGLGGELNDDFAWLQSASVANFDEVHRKLAKHAYRLKRLRPYFTRDGTRVAAIWWRDGVTAEHVLDVDAAALKQAMEAHAKGPLRPLDLTGWYVQAADGTEQVRFAAVWAADGSPQSSFDLFLDVREGMELETRMKPIYDRELALLARAYIYHNEANHVMAIWREPDADWHPLGNKNWAQESELPYFDRDDLFLEEVSFVQTSRPQTPWYYDLQWTSNPRFESQLIRRTTPDKLLEQSAPLTATGWRPSSISLRINDQQTMDAIALWHRPRLTEPQRDEQHRRRANLALAQWLLFQDPLVWQLLAFDSDATTRTYLIERLAPAGVELDILQNQFGLQTDPEVRQAILLAMGQASDFQRSAWRETGVPWLLDIFQKESHAGVHAAAEWLLTQRFAAADAVATAVRSWQSAVPKSDNLEGHWYVNSQGQTFVVLPGPAEFRMGSPHDEPAREPDEPTHRRRIGRRIAVSTKEVTVADFLAFRPLGYTRTLSPTADCPINNVALYDAAAYCRWLSEREGIPEDQMCFPRLEEIKSGMKLPENYLDRLGYRLPTEGEWEYACRAGSVGSHSFGGALELLPKYSILPDSVGETLERPASHPVATLKPSRWGLFDMHGNISEWCITNSGSYPYQPREEIAVDALTSFVIDDSVQYGRRGSSYSDVPVLHRSARRNSTPPNVNWGMIGFRVVRTMPAM